MSNEQHWILTDVDSGVWIESLELSGPELGLPSDSGVKITKQRLRGGLSDGVDIVTIDNGILSFAVLPTRGMGLWRGQFADKMLGWKSPVRGPVHPKFVNLEARGGLGWLQGFDECIVRCGLESNGAPCTDVLPNNMGVPTPVELGLHGRIANLPAHFVEVRVVPGGAGEPAEICLLGVVDEAMLFCPQFRLTTEYRTRLGSDTIHIIDRVENLGATTTEMELLYHCNFGSPVIDAGARLVLPSAATLPRDARAVESIDSWDRYLAPTPGYVEQCYWHVPLGDDAGDSVAMLVNAAGDFGVAMRYNIKQLPCFTQWKNSGAESDGYVTGLEPGTNYPNGRGFERRQGRVVKMSPGQEYRVDLALQVCADRHAVTGVEQEIAAIQGHREHNVHRLPQPKFSDLEG